MSIFILLFLLNLFHSSIIKNNNQYITEGNIDKTFHNLRILNNDTLIETSIDTPLKTSSQENPIHIISERNDFSINSESELLLLGINDFKQLDKSIHFFIYITFTKGKVLLESIQLPFYITYQNEIKEQKDINCKKEEDLEEIQKFNCSLDINNNVKILEMNDEVKYNGIEQKNIYFSPIIHYIKQNYIEYNKNMDLDKKFQNGITFYKNAKAQISQTKSQQFFSIIAETETENPIFSGLFEMQGLFFTTNDTLENLSCIFIAVAPQQMELDCLVKQNFSSYLNNSIILSNMKSLIIIFNKQDNDYINIISSNLSKQSNNETDPQTFNDYISIKNPPKSYVINSSSGFKAYYIILIILGIIIIIIFIISAIVCYRKRKDNYSVNSQANSSCTVKSDIYNYNQ